jgi:predicted nucleotidyltransferase
MIPFAKIRKFARQIGREYQPDRVVLFGSYARGDATNDSDVDVLVIMPYTGKSLEKSVEIRLRLDPDFPLDLLVRTPQEVFRRIEMGDSFMREIVTQGTVLYESHNSGMDIQGRG